MPSAEVHLLLSECDVVERKRIASTAGILAGDRKLKLVIPGRAEGHIAEIVFLE